MIRPALSLPGVRFALLFGVLVVSVAVPSTAFADGQAVVNAAASQAGKPYCWDGGNEAWAYTWNGRQWMPRQHGWLRLYRARNLCRVPGNRHFGVAP